MAKTSSVPLVPLACSVHVLPLLTISAPVSSQISSFGDEDSCCWNLFSLRLFRSCRRFVHDGNFRQMGLHPTSTSTSVESLGVLSSPDFDAL